LAWLTLVLVPASSYAQTPADDQFGDPEEVAKSFDEILSQPEFRRLRSKAPEIPDADLEAPGWLKRFLEWLGNLFSGTGKAFLSLGPLLKMLAWAILVAIACLIIWLVVRAVNNYRERHTIGMKRRRGYEEGEAEVPPGDLPADEYLRRAAELAAKGLFREAIGQLILGAMSRTERSGLIRFRRGLTHRDYLRALRGQSAQHQALRTIVDVYEPICFGRRPAQYDQYQSSLEGYQSGFRESLSSAAASPPKPADHPNDKL
jgi:hypothetical protein